MRWPWVPREQLDDLRHHLAARLSAQTEFDQRARQIEERFRVERDAEIARLQTLYERMLDQQSRMQEIALEKLMNLINYGEPVKRAAVVADREPDVEQRVARMVSEQTIETAVARLREEYAKIGVPVTDEELETEARGLVMGGSWSPPPTLAGMLD